MSNLKRDLFMTFNYLIQKAFKPYNIIIKSWIKFGNLDDIHKTFFVEEDRSITNKNSDNKEIFLNENYWENRFKY